MMSDELYDSERHERCANGRPCGEVVCRLVAADRSELEGYVEVAAELRITAARFAELHNYGLPVDVG